MNNIRLKIDKLIQKGVQISNPDNVFISEEVDIENISGKGTVIYPGCKIFGGNTIICEHSVIGYEGPVTIENCQIGTEVELKNGFFNKSVFLKKTKIGYGAHVREGSIFEEETSIAHTVGLKQTILFPFITLGSLINFCDCLMSGGTSRQNHSEVGSSYIHFNYTPNQDKATPSLLGDVPNGVMLNQRPIFLGGQGGLVGPSRLTFGSTVAAGTIYRKDELNPGRLLFGGGLNAGSIPFKTGIYQTVNRIFLNNIIYISNLISLMQWYKYVRRLFVSDNLSKKLHSGLVETLNIGIEERIYRLRQFCEKMPNSISEYSKDGINSGSKVILQQKELFDKRHQLEDIINDLKDYQGEEHMKNNFLNHIINSDLNNDYTQVIQNLDERITSQGTAWLQGIVDDVTFNIFNIMSFFELK